MLILFYAALSVTKATLSELEFVLDYSACLGKFSRLIFSSGKLQFPLRNYVMRWENFRRTIAWRIIPEIYPDGTAFNGMKGIINFSRNPCAQHARNFMVNLRINRKNIFSGRRHNQLIPPLAFKRFIAQDIRSLKLR